MNCFSVLCAVNSAKYIVESVQLNVSDCGGFYRIVLELVADKQPFCLKTIKYHLRSRYISCTLLTINCTLSKFVEKRRNC